MTGESDEVVFTVAGAEATRAATVGIEELGLTEPSHLEKWVIQHPETLGAGVMIVASQYDRWATPNGVSSRDRLDLLGLGHDGRLVVGELKRGRAPDTVELQAVKYAAMSSRFTLDQVASLHADFLQRTEGTHLTDDAAFEKLQAHCPDVELATDLLKPRIVLLAESYPDSTITSVLWLVDQGVDISLRKYQAYRTSGGETLVAVSQVYPPADIHASVLRPGGRNGPIRQPQDLPDVPWTGADFAKLLQLDFAVPIAVLNVCAEQPGEWVPSRAIYEAAGVSQPQGSGKLAGFGYSVRTTFGRSNHPWETHWKAGGENVNYYRVDDATAAIWAEATAAGAVGALQGRPPGGTGAE